MLVSVYLAGLVAMVGGKRRLGTAMDDDSIKTAAEACAADAVPVGRRFSGRDRSNGGLREARDSK